jgi:hypothetical protein
VVFRETSLDSVARRAAADERPSSIPPQPRADDADLVVIMALRAALLPPLTAAPVSAGALLVTSIDPRMVPAGKLEPADVASAHA